MLYILWLFGNDLHTDTDNNTFRHLRRIRNLQFLLRRDRWTLEEIICKRHSRLILHAGRIKSKQSYTYLLQYQIFNHLITI